MKNIFKSSNLQIFKFKFGGLAQLARAPALHAGGQGFESLILHQREYLSNKVPEYLS